MTRHFAAGLALFAVTFVMFASAQQPPVKPVDDAALAAALNYSRCAPQGGNRQPVRFLAVRDPALKSQLAQVDETSAISMHDEDVRKRSYEILTSVAD